MGNYHDLESEFIKRTLSLIDQYYDLMNNYPFTEQFNYTLTINCLLGLIVMPKERVISYVPTNTLTREYLSEIGVPSLEVRPTTRTLRELIVSLRHSVAHFDIKVISESDENLVDWLEFSDAEKNGELVARFRANELLPFLRQYASCLLTNLDMYRGR